MIKWVRNSEYSVVSSCNNFSIAKTGKDDSIKYTLFKKIKINTVDKNGNKTKKPSFYPEKVFSKPDRAKAYAELINVKEYLKSEG